MDLTRRNIMTLGAAAAATAATKKLASAQSFPFTPSARYPNPAIEILDPSFAKYRISSSTLEQVATGARWLEGPVYFADGRYLLVSDIPNNRIMKYDETNETWSVFREDSNYSNGHTRDMQGRLISCEHLTRRARRFRPSPALRGRKGTIPLPPLLTRYPLEQFHTGILGVTQVCALLAPGSNPPPAPEDGNFTNQCGLDRQLIKAGHVLRVIDATQM